MLHKTRSTRFNVVNTNSVNYAALEPIMLQSDSIMLPYTTHYATIICYNLTKSYNAASDADYGDKCPIKLHLLYHLQGSILQHHAAQDKQQSIQYNAAMMLYHKLTVCQTLQTQ